MDDLSNAHRGGRRKQGLLEPEEETPFMPMWQTIMRYTLEVLGIIFLSTWAATRQTNTGLFWGIVVGILLCWRIFSVRDDPATMEQPCVQVPGIVRILLELGVYTLAFICLWDLMDTKFGLPAEISYVYIVAVAVYYCVTHERVMWVLKQ